MATLDGDTVLLLLLRTTDSGAKVAQLRQKNKLKEGRSRRTNDDNLGSLAVIGVIDCDGGLFVSASWQPSFFSQFHSSPRGALDDTKSGTVTQFALARYIRPAHRPLQN